MDRREGSAMRDTDRPQISEQVRQYVQQLHAVVDQLVDPLHQQHAERLQCALGCMRCCVDELTVFEVEADRIRDAIQGQELVPAPVGRCVMLDEAGACRVYAVRPYVCRSQGLPLRWGESTADGPVEHRDICPLNESGSELSSLPADQCWTLGPIESRLAHAQQMAQEARGEAGDAPLRRVRLRDLLGSEAV